MEDRTEDLDPMVFRTYTELFSSELLGQLYRDFLTQTRERVTEIQRGVAPGVLQALGHTIAGTAGMLGAALIARRAKELEERPECCEPFRLEGLLAACNTLEFRLRGERVEL